ncbi:MAG: hypothetical protein KGN34_05145 [Sphingomonadales bacterium]|nr:hypothetical protein [Sphingomonadales bacterium]
MTVASPEPPGQPDESESGAAAVMARLLLQASRLREERFPELVDDDLPWRMLLALHAEPEGLAIETLFRQIGVRNGLPIRWLHQLHDAGLVKSKANVAGRLGAVLSREGRVRLTTCLADSVLAAGAH